MLPLILERWGAGFRSDSARAETSAPLLQSSMARIHWGKNNLVVLKTGGKVFEERCEIKSSPP